MDNTKQMIRAAFDDTKTKRSRERKKKKHNVKKRSQKKSEKKITEINTHSATVIMTTELRTVLKGKSFCSLCVHLMFFYAFVCV